MKKILISKNKRLYSLIEFVFLDESNIDEWVNYVKNNSKAEIFHLLQWKDVYSQTYKYKPHYYY
jgi:hypothetical protein